MSKTVTDYKQALVTTAAERLELCSKHGLTPEVAQTIVADSLGKSSQMFQALVARHSGV